MLLFLLHLLAAEERSRKAHADNRSTAMVVLACCPQTALPGYSELPCSWLTSLYYHWALHVGLLLSVVCVFATCCHHPSSSSSSSSSSFLSPRIAIAKPTQRMETRLFPSLLRSCSRLHRESLKWVGESPCPKPLSAPCFFFPEVEGDRRGSFSLSFDGSFLWLPKSPGTSRLQAPDRHHEAGFNRSMHAYIIAWLVLLECCDAVTLMSWVALLMLAGLGGAVGPLHLQDHQVLWLLLPQVVCGGQRLAHTCCFTWVLIKFHLLLGASVYIFKEPAGPADAAV